MTRHSLQETSASRAAARARRTQPNAHEAGAVLVLFVLLVVAILGLAGLLLDLGLARVVQGRMQGAVEGAALEGLAWRDHLPLSSDAATREELRRARARLVLLRAFDEDGEQLDGLADGSAPNSALALGLGPAITGANSGGLAGETVSVVTPALIPDPQLNLTNAQHGDFVAGTHAPTHDPATCAATLGVPMGFLENAAYERCDFMAPDATGDPDLAQQQPAFLARLRRSSDPLGLDGVPGVSSHAPTLPYLLGRGAAVLADGGAAVNAGLVLRGTAIASARPALVAAFPPNDAGLALVDAGLALVDLVDPYLCSDGAVEPQGVLALSVDAWVACFSGGASQELRFEPGGQVALVIQCPGLPVVVGRVIQAGLTTCKLVAVGEPALVAGEFLALEYHDAELALVALYDTLDVDRVVAFGAVVLEPPSSSSGFPRLRRLEGPGSGGLILPRGASAVFVPRRHPALAAATLSAVLQAGDDPELLPSVVLAPTLAR